MAGSEETPTFCLYQGDPSPLRGPVRRGRNPRLIVQTVQPEAEIPWRVSDADEGTHTVVSLKDGAEGYGK